VAVAGAGPAERASRSRARWLPSRLSGFGTWLNSSVPQHRRQFGSAVADAPRSGGSWWSARRSQFGAQDMRRDQHVTRPTHRAPAIHPVSRSASASNRSPNGWNPICRLYRPPMTRWIVPHSQIAVASTPVWAASRLALACRSSPVSGLHRMMVPRSHARSARRPPGSMSLNAPSAAWSTLRSWPWTVTPDQTSDPGPGLLPAQTSRRQDPQRSHALPEAAPRRCPLSHHDPTHGDLSAADALTKRGAVRLTDLPVPSVMVGSGMSSRREPRACNRPTHRDSGRARSGNKRARRDCCAGR
jgi:hypothetical protein